MNNALLASDVSSNTIPGFVFLGLGLIIYFLPAIVAHNHRHHNATAICAVNLLLGWTFLGWVLALVWALTRPAGQPTSLPMFSKPTMRHTLIALGIVGGFMMLLILASIIVSVNQTKPEAPMAGIQEASYTATANVVPDASSTPDAIPSPTPVHHRNRHHYAHQ